MSYILHIESATRVCSVALSANDQLLALRESHTESYSHSGLLTVFIEEVLQEAGVPVADLDAVSVSMGPGSYTGLRIGVSAAKGLCYGLDIPMIAVDTLTGLAHHGRQILSERPDIISPEALEALYCPMVDARRMEVYTRLFDCRLKPLQDIRAEIIEPDSFSDRLSDHKIFFFGDGAEKCKTLRTRINAIFPGQINASATGLIQPAYQRFQNRDYVNLAYFEPYYLKDFVAGKARVKGL